MDGYRVHETSASIECERRREGVVTVYTCGGCQRKYQNISILHEHLISHIEGGSYHYDNNSKTAFPKYDYKCAETQTDLDLIENNGGVDSCELKTQTIISGELKCSETTSTTFLDLQNGHSDYQNGVSYMINIHKPTLNREADICTVYEQSTGIKTELNIDSCTDIETNNIYMGTDEQNIDVNIGMNNMLTSIKKETSHQNCDMECVQEIYATDFKRKNKTDNDDQMLTTYAMVPKSLHRCKKKSSLTQESNYNTVKNVTETSQLSLKLESKPVKEFEAANDNNNDDNNDLISDMVDYITVDDKTYDLNDKKANTIQHKKRKNIIKNCTKCDRSFSKIDSFKNHLYKVHGDQPWVCSKCEKSFKYKAELNSHKISEHSGASSKCDICNIFVNSQNLRKHRIEKHFTKLSEYKCIECKRQFINKTHYKLHMESSIHGKSPVQFICEICGFQSHKRGAMKYHKYNKHKERVRKYECTECSYKAYEKKHLIKHMDCIHLGKKESVCDICGKSFKSPSTLCVHMRIHTGEKPFKCRICQKDFKDLGGLSKHRQIHEDDKRHKCTHCDKTFVQKSNCKAHMRQHTGDKPFVCDVCGAGFTHNVSKTNHMLKAH